MAEAAGLFFLLGSFLAPVAIGLALRAYFAKAARRLHD
jgi:hypothetical protein